MPDPMSPVVEPKADTAPASVESATPDSAPAEETPTAAGLPDELIQIPALQAVFAGAPAAVSAPIKEFATRPEGKMIIDNKDALLKAGMGLYRSLAGDLGVIFNALRIHPQQLQQADKAGQLAQVAPSFDAVNAAVAKSGQNHPSLGVSGVPSGPPAAPMPTPPQMAAMPGPAPKQAPASVQNKAFTARSNSLVKDSPSSGPAPGRGRLLNSILKPVV